MYTFPKANARYFQKASLEDFDDFCEVVTDYGEEERRVYCFHCQIRAGMGSAGMTTQGGALLDNEFLTGVNVSSICIRKVREKLQKHANAMNPKKYVC